MKKFITSLCALALVAVVGIGLAACSTKAKTYTCSAGLTVSLDGKFYEKSIASQTYYLESKNVIFCALKEEFSAFASQNTAKNMSLEEYANMVIANNNMKGSVSPKTDENGLIYFTYDKTVTGRDFFYYAVVKKGTDAFWLCQFACEKKNQSALQDKFVKWSATIVVA